MFLVDAGAGFGDAPQNGIGEAIEVLPALSRTIQPGDELLFCGRDCDIHLLDASLNNPYTLGYLISGRDEIRSSLLCWLFQRREHTTS